MFAPQQYPGLQPQAYCQYLPAPFMPQQMTPLLPNNQQDVREKRNLSPTTPISPTAISEEKRRRNQSGDDIDSDSVSKEPTMTDLKTYMDAIMARLNTTATKIDIASINDKITAQNLEIDQLKSRMQKHDEEMKKLQTTIDEGVAARLHRNLESADLRTRLTTTNMAASDPERSKFTTSTRTNLIIEGLEGDMEEEMIANVIKICASIKITIYASEIEAVTRYKRRDENSKKPGPVNVTLSRALLRDTILRKKNGLKDVPAMQGIFINADEPLEVRKGKSILRKIARNVKSMGESIEIRHDRIEIDGVWYTVRDIDRIPDKYKPIDEEDMGAVGGDELKPDSTKSETAIRKRRLIKRGEKMRITKAGLLFSGPTAYISNMAYAPIKVGDTPHDSNEEAYQYRKAKDHGCDGLAEAILHMEDTHEIKRETKSIVTTEEWNKDAPNKLWDLFDLKMKEHPDLLERLIETAPLPLIEASNDDRWGGGPLSTLKYTTMEKSQAKMYLEKWQQNTGIKKYSNDRKHRDMDLGAHWKINDCYIILIILFGAG